MWVIRKFRPYLEGYTFKVLTDHIALKWLHNLKNPTGRLARWVLELLEYDYEIVYRKGSLNYAPDALSRTSEKLNSTASTLALIKEKEKNKYNIAKKLNKSFEGPFFIKTKISPTIYGIKNKTGKSLDNWNVKDIKKYTVKTE